MSGIFQICSDGHHCDNGSKCLKVQQGDYTCDCTQIKDKVFAGLRCEHEATQYCNDQNDVSHKSFCTNDGTCKKITEDDEHGGCNCVGEYMGDHCEYTKGIELPDHVKDELGLNDNSGGGGGLSGGAVAAIVIVVLAAVLGVGLFLIRKRLRQWDPTAERHKDSARAAPDLVLEADGGVLMDSVKSGAGVNSPAFSAASGGAESGELFPDAVENNGYDAEKANESTSGDLDTGSASAVVSPATSSSMESGAAPDTTSPAAENGAVPDTTPPTPENGAAVIEKDPSAEMDSMLNGAESTPTETAVPPAAPAAAPTTEPDVPPAVPPAAPAENNNDAVENTAEQGETTEDTRFEIV